MSTSIGPEYVPESTEPGCFPPTAVWYGHEYLTETELPLGQWHVMANGRIFRLDIESVSGRDVTGIFNTFEIKGEWNGHARAGKLTFIRRETAITQKFTGYLMAYPEVGEWQWRMAGTFGLFDKASPEDYVDQGGWYATRLRED